MIAIVLFLVLPVQRAIILSLVSAYLLLPTKTAFDFPVVPDLDKTTIPNICAFVLSIALAKGSTWKMPRSGTAIVLIGMYVFTPILTGWNNQEPLILGSTVVPGMRPYDWFSAAGTRLLHILPFIIGIGTLSEERDQRTLIAAFAVSALFYSLPILWELRMSPQLHVKLYGFFPHEFQQMARGGGYRPVVFLGHGLLVSAFVMMASLAAIGMWRHKMPMKYVPASLAAGYLVVILILCKSFGAILICAFLGIVAITMSKRAIVRLLSIFALMIVSYPALRGFDLIPTSQILSLASQGGTDRASSLEFRFINEDALLKKARQKPMFGWGTWGRNSMMMSEDNEHVQQKVVDGQWIIEFGSFGWAGYFSTFGLLCLPFILAVRKGRAASWNNASTTLLIMLLANLIDLIPNSSLTPLTWLIAGSLCGSLLRRQPAQPPKVPGLKPIRRFPTVPNQPEEALAISVTPAAGRALT